MGAAAVFILGCMAGPWLEPVRTLSVEKEEEAWILERPSMRAGFRFWH